MRRYNSLRKQYFCWVKNRLYVFFIRYQGNKCGWTNGTRRTREREWFRLTCTRGKSNTCARYIWAWRNGMAPVHSRFQSHSFSYVSKNNDDSGNENGRLLCRPAIRQQYEQNAGEALGQRKLWPLDREHVYEVCKKFRRCWDLFHYQNKQGKKSSCGKRTIRSCYSLSVHKVWASPQTTKDISKPQKNSPVRVNKNISKVTFSICLVN